MNCILTNLNVNGASNGWTKSTLKLLIASLSLLSFSAFSAEQTVTLSDKVTVALVVVIFANAAIPYVKHLVTQHSKKTSYLAYLSANINSTLTRFGPDISAEATKNYLDTLENTSWLDALAEAGKGVPSIFPQIHNLLHKSLNDTSPHRYHPFIGYSGMPVSELDHDHPIWVLKESETKVISDYLLSQQQVEKSAKDQYESPFYELASSECDVKHRQWINGGFKILDEMAEHYVNTQRLKMHLMIKHSIKFK